MFLDLVGRSSKPFLAFLLISFPLFDLGALLLELCEAGGEVVPFVEEFAHLGEEDGVGEKETAVLVVVTEILIFLVVIHEDLYVTIIVLSKMCNRQ
jgi:hypothetical protein